MPDRALGRTEGSGASRTLVGLAKLWLVNLPIAALAHGIAHDYGHFARLDEQSIHARHRHISQWPWPVPITISDEDFAGGERLAPERLLAVSGGGEQASAALRQSLA